MSVQENISPESTGYVDTILAHEFKLNIEGHELVDPISNRGRVVSVDRIPTEEMHGNIVKTSLYQVDVIDPFVEADPQGYDMVRDYIGRMGKRLSNDGIDMLQADRKEATSREDRNKYTNAWLASSGVESLSLWRDLVPTAEALEYLTNPTAGRIIANRSGDAAIISPETALQLRFVDDAVAIRDRAVAMQDIVEAHLAELRESKKSVRWLSLASGTAEPAIAAARAAQDLAEAEGDTLDVSLTVADYDGKSLKYVKKNAEQYGFDGEVNTVLQNILTETLAEELAEATGSGEQYDVVENMGFEEYLPQDGDELEAKKGLGLPQASEFTRRAYDLVKPGGILISGNMVLDRPQLDFVFGIVDWPIINARSEESILRVYAEAGILDNPNAKVEMYRVRNKMTGANVYNIVKVTKLA